MGPEDLRQRLSQGRGCRSRQGHGTETRRRQHTQDLVTHPGMTGRQCVSGPLGSALCGRTAAPKPPCGSRGCRVGRSLFWLGSVCCVLVGATAMKVPCRRGLGLNWPPALILSLPEPPDQVPAGWPGGQLSCGEKQALSCPPWIPGAVVWHGLEAGLVHVLFTSSSLCDAGWGALPLELQFPQRLFPKGRVTRFLGENPASLRLLSGARRLGGSCGWLLPACWHVLADRVPGTPEALWPRQAKQPGWVPQSSCQTCQPMPVPFPSGPSLCLAPCPWAAVGPLLRDCSGP